MEQKKYLPIIPRYSPSKKTNPEELDDILLHAVISDWAKQEYLQGWYFEENSYKKT